MATIIREDKLKGSQSGSSRFSQIIKHTGLRYGHKDLDMQLWTVDGTNGTTYAADTGTDGQQQHPTQEFAHDSDDYMFTRFMVPPDYKPGGDLELFLWFYSSDHDDTHTMAWDVTVHSIPTTSAIASEDDHTSNVTLDTAGTAVAADQAAYVDETASEIKCSIIDLTNGGSSDYDPFDVLLVSVGNDSSESTISAAALVCHSAVVYER